MAEFSEVMKQAKRMCNAYGFECGPCELHKKYGLCPLCAQVDDHIPADWKLDKMEDVERIVMLWAAEHPEQRYPTWKEWQDATFPDADVLCPRMFVSKTRVVCNRTKMCGECAEDPIPADIAEKLGIKSIGGTEDEKA